MKCYVCAEQGKDTDAVAICIVCGMGLCTEHAIREETEIWSGGYPFLQRRSRAHFQGYSVPTVIT